MLTEFFNNTVHWVGAHPLAAGIVVFLIAFSDALIILGAIVPALPLLFAIGMLIGLGEISAPYAIACATLGALAGDGLSFWVGWRWGQRLHSVWPFRRYPQLLERGERLFLRNALKSIFIARYVGAVRPFVPAIAGMARWPLRQYLPASLTACLSWSVLFLAPGWLFGASWDAVAAVANRLLLVLGGLVAVFALGWFAVISIYHWFDRHANSLLERGLRWSQAHPQIGRHMGALIDPNRPESASLAVLAICLLGISWAWFALLATVLMRREPLLLDLAVFETMIGLRNPLADPLMAGLASLGDGWVLGPAAALALAWLMWRRRWMAAAHWLAALGFGLALTTLLDVLIEMPRPPTAPSGFGFPSIQVTMMTVTFGFFAVLIARELPGRSRVWPYLLASTVIATLGFARLYLGAHWLSDIVGGILLGVVWLLILGMAYRRRAARSFWMRPLALVFYLSFSAAALWHAPRVAEPMLTRFHPPAPSEVISAPEWWADGWTALPSRRNERSSDSRWPLNIQAAGPLPPLQARLEARGWVVQPQADWVTALGLLDDDTPADEQPVLPATLGTDAETLLMRRTVGERRLQVLRLWRAPLLLDDARPLWIGTVQTLVYTEPLWGLFNLWRPESGNDGWQALREALDGWEMETAEHPQSGVWVLRVLIAAETSSSIFHSLRE